MALYERRPTLLSVQQAQRQAAITNRRVNDRGATKLFTGLSVSGVTTAAPKDVFASDLTAVLVDDGMIEVYAGFTGTIGSGQTMTLSLRMDGTNYGFLTWTGAVTSEKRWSSASNAAGVTGTRGGFQVRLDDLSAGHHTFNFRFTVSGGTGSATSGVIAYRII